MPCFGGGVKRSSLAGGGPLGAGMVTSWTVSDKLLVQSKGLAGSCTCTTSSSDRCRNTSGITQELHKCQVPSAIDAWRHVEIGSSCDTKITRLYIVGRLFTDGCGTVLQHACIQYIVASKDNIHQRPPTFAEGLISAIVAHSTRLRQDEPPRSLEPSL